VLDKRDREWLITYESLCSAGQRHTRFAAGWATLCKANDFKVGETIVFSRWGKRGSGVVVVACDNCALSKKQNKKLCFLPPIQAHLLLQGFCSRFSNQNTAACLWKGDRVSSIRVFTKKIRFAA
jgi:hypothetical protein